MVASEIRHKPGKAPPGIGDVIRRLTWHEAKSYSHFMPHQWADGRRNPDDFQTLVKAIGEHGVREYFHGKGRKYLYFGGYRYWWMLFVINRMKIADMKVLAPEHRVYKSLADARAGVNPIGVD
jgi:hypothetical protein